MQQSAKFVDLRRTYLPINANTFPTSMHGTDKEDSPENRIPVMAYEGKNILPTAQGYKSYFGTDQILDIDALPARADHVFIYQNLTFANVLIALTESGIWIKKANVTGAWVQALAMTVPLEPTTHYEWTYVVISNNLYVYKQSYASYQKIVSDVTDGVVITSHVPNTLNMAGQMGIFRAGGRLGFWDSDDSIAWSNQDDYEDFEPSITTFAGSSKFIDVNGRIVTIVGHGSGFMIYATKSIIYVRANTSATFQWDPDVIFSTNGITYPRQCVASSPDTTHFAYTSEGLYKIEDGREEVLVTEVTDALALHSGPIYLAMSEGRYLYLQILDEDYLESLTQFTQGTTGSTGYYFPGYTGTLAEAVADELLVGSNMCSTIGNMNNGQFADAPTDPGDKKEGTDFSPIWTAYLSKKGVWGNISGWTNVPVATIDPNGVEVNQCPLGAEGNLLSANNTTSSGKTVLAGSDLYIDGIWTMERFATVQQAIWDLEQESIDNFFNQLLARTATVTKVTNSATPVTNPLTVDKQLIGDYARNYTKGFFGFSKCEFWLTRYCFRSSKVYRIKKNIKTSEDTRQPAILLGYTGYWSGPDTGAYPPGAIYGSVDACAAALAANLSGVSYYTAGAPYSGAAIYIVPGGRYSLVALASYTSPSYTENIYAVYADEPSRTTYSVIVGADPIREHYTEETAGRYKISDTMIATNVEEPYDVNPIIPDTGYCTLEGWDYTKNDDSPGTVSVSACSASAVFPPGSTVREAPEFYPAATIASDGSFCSIPFQPVTIPGTPAVEVNWPDTYVPLPAGSFLLQDGSIAPVYPTFQGALVYDLRLKKWGNYTGAYKLLLNYSPINQTDSGVIPYSVFGILGGILSGDGLIKLFTDNPLDSYITYGKLGFYRLGITSCEEVHVNFDRPSTGYVTVETSVEGRFIDPALSTATAFTNANKIRHTGSYPGSWNNIKISGNFQISYLEYRARTNGKR